MKILVTGSSGHLGEALLRVLKVKKYDVMGIDLLASEFTDRVGSIDERSFVEQCVKGMDAIIHTATLHKPHINSHSYQDFIDTNVTGTLNLLEAARLFNVKSFIYTSTTSTFGDALTPPPDAPATWITEDVIPMPKNIYGVTKVAAEDLCQLFYRNHGVSCLVLKTSRFFPEEDDNKDLRDKYQNANLKVNELLYRRVDIEDIVHAHILALHKASSIGFAKYIISATTPFAEEDLADLHEDAPKVVKRLFPDYEKVYASLGWKMFPRIERVYVNERVRRALGWQPKYNFRTALDRLTAGNTFQSELAIAIGSKGYHDQEFENRPYP